MITKWLSKRKFSDKNFRRFMSDLCLFIKEVTKNDKKKDK